MANFNVFYPPAGGGSNASVGTNGATAPTSSTEIGGINPSGNLTGVKVDANGYLITTSDPAIVEHVIVDSSALPLGAATEATLQIVANTVATDTGSITTKLMTIGGHNGVQSNVLHVTNSGQALTATTLVAGTALVGKVGIDQTTPGTTNGVVVNQALPPGTNSIGQITANAGTNLNTSALNLESTQSAMSAKLPATLGQTTSALSLATVLASDQPAIPVNVQTLPVSYNFGSADAQTQRVVIAGNQPTIPTSTTDIAVSGTITTQNLVPAGTATANSAVLTGDLNSIGTCMVQVTGTYTGALSLQITIDNTTWVTVGGTPFINMNTGAFSATITSGTEGIFQFDVAGARQARITALAAVTGTVTASIRASRGSGVVSVDSAVVLGAGSATIGALTANQSTSMDQVAGVTTAVGLGTTSTGTQRVVMATGATPTTANVSASITNVTVLAASVTRAGAVFYNDSTSVAYLKFGATASATSFTVLLQPQAYYELPGPVIYNGIIDCIWASASGSMRVTSWTT